MSILSIYRTPSEIISAAETTLQLKQQQMQQLQQQQQQQVSRNNSNY